MNKQIFNRLAMLLFIVAVIVGTVVAVIIINQSQHQNDFNHLETVDYGSDDNDDDLPTMSYQILMMSQKDTDIRYDWPEEPITVGDTINLHYNVNTGIMEIQHYHHYAEQKSLYVWE